MRFKAVLILILLIPNIMNSQNATATIDNALSCAGDTVLVPVNVTNFMDVAAMTLFIGYDTIASEFISLQNINQAVTGYLTVNATNGQVGVAYSNINPFSITSGKLFDLKFAFNGDSTYLPFDDGTEIANSNLEIIPLETFAGSISNGLVIINQPDSVQAYPDNDVFFNVTAAGNVTYQWQENTGTEWYDLQNNSTYSGVNDDTLTINDVSLDFDGNLYRCMISSGNCSVISDVALLEVALTFPSTTLGSMLSCPEMEVNEPQYVADFYDIVSFTFNISFNTDNLEFQELLNINPLLNPVDITVTALQGMPGISIHWENAAPVTILNDKLFDLNFLYHSQDNILVFEDGTEVFNSSLNSIDLTITNGYISQFEMPAINQQPVDITVTEGEEAIFTVLSTGAIGYQWQESIDEGVSWSVLSNSPPYYNVTTQELKIDPTSLSMDGNQYSCIIENEHCSIISNSAILTVDSLTILVESSIHHSDLVTQPNPFVDYLIIFKNRNYSDLVFSIYNLNGKPVYSGRDDRQSTSETVVNLTALPEGIYLLEISGDYNENHFIETRKIIKTK